MGDMLNRLSSQLIYTLWDLKDQSVRMEAWRVLEKTQWLPGKELRLRQWKKLGEILSNAYENCVFYRRSFDQLGVHPSAIQSLQDFRRIPILTKKDIQGHTDELISRQFVKDQLISSKTGGSTGKALRLYFDKQCEEMRNAAALRSDRWAGWELGMKKAAVWGNPPTFDTFKKRVRNGLHDRLIYLDTMEINESSLSAFVKRWRQYQPSALFGHSHSLYILARYLREKKIDDLEPRAIISTSMMLLPRERELIENVFACKVTDRYGCEEVGLIACECETHHGMHLNFDHVYVEFIKQDGFPAGPGEEGHIVVTDLVNRGMPLIRYKVEDVGVPADRECSCGRGLPLMEKVTGRVADFLVRRDGSLVAGISLVERTLTAIQGIDQLQILQEDLNTLILNLVRMEGYGAESEEALREEFHNVFGREIQMTVNYVSRIPQESSGKYRFSICKIRTND
jgi:phenylacetate-coenzyme A ligase PaaK-like adenylate-forming protein